MVVYYSIFLNIFIEHSDQLWILKEMFTVEKLCSMSPSLYKNIVFKLMHLQWNVYGAKQKMSVSYLFYKVLILWYLTCRFLYRNCDSDKVLLLQCLACYISTERAIVLESNQLFFISDTVTELNLNWTMSIS